MTRRWLLLAHLALWLLAVPGCQTAAPPRMPSSATPPAGATLTSDVDGMLMVYVPAGEFSMGSSDADPAADEDEKPPHTVYLDAFWIDRTEVTNAMYTQCVAAGECTAPMHSQRYGQAAYAHHPVLGVAWTQAGEYCGWAGRRLSTEAEWEKAARGTDGRLYPWGNDPPDATRLNFNQWVGDTTEVGQYPTGASPYGALDMAGNVWEWVADGYDPQYYSHSPPQNPPGGASVNQPCCVAARGTMKLATCARPIAFGRFRGGTTPTAFAAPAHLEGDCVASAVS